MHPFSNQSTLLTTQILCSRPLDLVKSFSGGLSRNFPRPLYIYIISLLGVFVKGIFEKISKTFRFLLILLLKLNFCVHHSTRHPFSRQDYGLYLPLTFTIITQTFQFVNSFFNFFNLFLQNTPSFYREYLLARQCQDFQII